MTLVHLRLPRDPSWGQHFSEPHCANLVWTDLAELKAQNESLRVALVQQNAELAARLARLEEGAACAAALTGR